MSTTTVTQSLQLFARETSTVITALAENSTDKFDEVVALLRTAESVFFLGAGRSGLALKMTAMRFMHLGLTVHVVGETTTPAISQGDVLFVASGSGTTGVVVRATKTALAAGAHVIALTTAADSPLGAMATITVTIPAAQKLDRGSALSEQYAGGLFEQSTMLVGDALFHTMWKQSGKTADDIWPTHANLE
ncbi:MAG: 6-phospho-3-hexuloisomerase [Alpinimonas sp.]|jgi:6-phospho-3-hexuloisomerase